MIFGYISPCFTRNPWSVESPAASLAAVEDTGVVDGHSSVATVDGAEESAELWTRAGRTRGITESLEGAESPPIEGGNGCFHPKWVDSGRK